MSVSLAELVRRGAITPLDRQVALAVARGSGVETDDAVLLGLAMITIGGFFRN